MDKTPKVFKIAVVNDATGQRDPWLWNQQAETEQQAKAEAEKNLRMLGWSRDWRVESATLITVAR